MSLYEFQYGAAGIQLITQILDQTGTPLDLTTNTAITVVLGKPDGTTVTKTATLLTPPGTDGKIYYTTLAGDLNAVGTWSIQGTATISGIQYLARLDTFYVLPNVSLARLITSIRGLAGDTYSDNPITAEQLGGNDQPSYPVDGSNRLFLLKSTPVVPGSVYVTIIGTGAVQRSNSTSLFTLTNQYQGVITFASAPNPGSATATAGVYVDYNFYMFSDAKYVEFLQQGARFALAGTTDPSTIPNGLDEAMLQFALSQYWNARSSQEAKKYASSGGGASEAVETVAQAYRNLAKDAFKNAVGERTAYYQRQGQREAPAWADVTINWDPISPKR